MLTKINTLPSIPLVINVVMMNPVKLANLIFQQLQILRMMSVNGNHLRYSVMNPLRGRVIAAVVSVGAPCTTQFCTSRGNVVYLG